MKHFVHMIMIRSFTTCQHSILRPPERNQINSENLTKPLKKSRLFAYKFTVIFPLCHRILAVPHWLHKNFLSSASVAAASTLPLYYPAGLRSSPRSVPAGLQGFLRHTCISRADDNFQITQYADACGQKFYTVAFIIADKHEPSRAWDGRIPMDKNLYADQINAIRSRRRADVIVLPFGSAGGTGAGHRPETNTAALEAKYQSVIDR